VKSSQFFSVTKEQESASQLMSRRWDLRVLTVCYALGANPLSGKIQVFTGEMPMARNPDLILTDVAALSQPSTNILSNICLVSVRCVTGIKQQNLFIPVMFTRSKERFLHRLQ
jgi:hypothetical protein